MRNLVRRANDDLWKKTFGWDPFESLSETFINMFDDVISYPDGSNTVIELEVPGFNKDNLEVELAGGRLTIKGKRDIKTENFAGRREINKSYTVGKVSDADAQIKDGILRIVLKSEEKDVRKIEFKEV